MGLTDYRSFLSTNWSPKCNELKEAGHADHGDATAYLAHPLGVGALLETNDGYLCFIQRSQHVGEYPGFLDCPGGHPEPTAIGISPEGRLQLMRDQPLVLRGHGAGADEPSLGSRVVHEFFDSIVEEVVGEVNVGRDRLEPPRLVGIFGQNESGGRPSACFHVHASLPRTEVLKLYQEGGAESEESTRLVFLTIDEADEAMKSVAGTETAEQICTSGVTRWVTPGGGLEMHLFLAARCKPVSLAASVCAGGRALASRRQPRPACGCGGAGARRKMRESREFVFRCFNYVISDAR